METIDRLLKGITPNQETILDIEREALGEGEGKEGRKVTLVLKHQPVPPEAPVRAESPRRDHCFHEISGFAQYLKRFKGKAPVVYADVPENTISAVLDESAEKGREIVVFEPQIHPRWAPWEAVIGNPMKIGDFVDFVRNNRRSITEPEGRELALALSQVKASREVTMHQGQGKHSLNGLIVKLNIQGKEDTQHVELPDEITVHAPIFVGVGAEAHQLDLILDASEQHGVIARLAAGDLLEAKIQAFESIVDTLRVALGTDEKDANAFTFTMGSPSWAPWEYLRSERNAAR